MSASNIYPFRSGLDGEVTIDFPIPVRDMQITNTSGSAILKWKFRAGQNYSELEPTEIITMEQVHVNKLILSAVSGSYRVLGQG